MRIRLADRRLPDYSKGEELFNAVSHIAGGAFAVAALVLCLIKSAGGGDVLSIASSAVYGTCMILLYCMSSIYHGLRPTLGKKVFQILDHCAIYLMIAGTYTPILLVGMRPSYPALAWTFFGMEWGLTALAVTLTAIDLKQYGIFSMICYIAMGWGIVLFIPEATAALSKTGFLFTLLGGISYTLGAVLYGIGSKRRYCHGAFHVFVLMGSILQFIAIYRYIL